MASWRPLPHVNCAFGTFPLTASFALKGGLAILEHTVFAGSHFLVNIMLARWLIPEDYGAFAFGYSAFLFVASFQMALFSEPMLVLGPKKKVRDQSAYIGKILAAQLVVSLPLVLLILSISFTLDNLGSYQIAESLLGLCVATPMILSMWLLRRACYLTLRTGWATVGAFLYLVLLIVLLSCLRYSNTLSQLTAFLSMGLGAFSVTLLLALILRPKCLCSVTSTTALLREHWCYGRWALGTTALSWLLPNIYLIVLPFWLGLEVIAEIRVLLNLAMPALLTGTALSMVLLPILSRLQKENISLMKETINLASFCFIILTGIYACLLISLSEPLLVMLFGPRYLALAPLVPLVGFLTLVSNASVIISNGLRALERPNTIFWSYLVGGILTVVIAVPLAVRLGVSGAIWGQAICTFFVSLSLFFLYLKECPSSARSKHYRLHPNVQNHETAEGR